VEVVRNISSVVEESKIPAVAGIKVYRAVPEYLATAQFLKLSSIRWGILNQF